MSTKDLTCHHCSIHWPSWLHWFFEVNCCLGAIHLKFRRSSIYYWHWLILICTHLKYVGLNIPKTGPVLYCSPPAGWQIYITNFQNTKKAKYQTTWTSAVARACWYPPSLPVLAKNISKHQKMIIIPIIGNNPDNTLPTIPPARRGSSVKPTLQSSYINI